MSNKNLVYNPRTNKQIFTSESKGRIWEIFYNSDNDKISLLKFKKFQTYFDQESAIDMNKKEFMELLKFFKSIKLGKNKTVSVKWMSKALYESINKKKK